MSPAPRTEIAPGSYADAASRAFDYYLGAARAAVGDFARGQVAASPDPVLRPTPAAAADARGAFRNDTRAPAASALPLPVKVGYTQAVAALERAAGQPGTYARRSLLVSDLENLDERWDAGPGYASWSSLRARLDTIGDDELRAGTSGVVLEDGPRRPVGPDASPGRAFRASLGESAAETGREAAAEIRQAAGDVAGGAAASVRDGLVSWADGFRRDVTEAATGAAKGEVGEQFAAIRPYLPWIAVGGAVLVLVLVLK